MASTVHNLTASWGQGVAGQAAPVSSSDDAALVRRAQSGDQMAFREIVDRYQVRVMSFIHRILRNRNEAEDIAQEVFASAFLSIRNFKLQSTLVSWLYRITINECFEYLRRKKVRPLVYESDLSEDAVRAIRNNRRHTAEPGFDAALAKREILLALLDRLSSEDRTMLLLKEVEGYSLSEIEGITGVAENTIKVRLFRAREKLAKNRKFAGSARLQRASIGADRTV